MVSSGIANGDHGHRAEVSWQAEGLGCCSFVKGAHPTSAQSQGRDSQQDVLGGGSGVLQAIQLHASASVAPGRTSRISANDDDHRRNGDKPLAVSSLG